MATLKVGSVMRVFKIKVDFYGMGRAGQQCCEDYKSEYFENIYGVNLLTGHKWYNHFGIDERKEAKLIGQLRITKLK